MVFVPIMFLFRPYQVVSEIWKVSDPKVDLIDGAAWKNAKTSSIVGWWWAFFLISNFLGQIVFRMTLGAEEPPELLASTYTYMVSDSIDVVGMLITILMVRRISQFQEAKKNVISSTKFLQEQYQQTGF
jgi:Na+/proline symporter